MLATSGEEGAAAPAKTGTTLTGRAVGYTMTILFVIYALNMLDRQIVNILAEPIKRDLGISDAEIGILTGLAFAVFYTFLGIPIARITDRHEVNRSRLLAVSLTLWSGMTALCGLAANYWQLLFLRVFVGVGEASCVPASQAIVADLVPVHKRATYMGILSAGIPVGRLIGLIVGGVIAHLYGWRVAFVIVGLPGLLVAALAWWTVPDPRRSAAHEVVEEAKLTVTQAFKALQPIRTYWLANLGAAFVSFIAYGQAAFVSSFLIRVHHLNVGQTGILLGLTSGIAGVAGSYAGGWLADHRGMGNIGSYMLVPAIATLVASALFPFAVLSPSLTVAITLLAISAGLSSMWLGPTFATLQLLAPRGARATAVAIHMLIVNAIGLGFGPMLFGWLSDVFNKGGNIAGLTIAPAGPADGLRYALAWGSVVGLISVAFFLLASRTIKRDVETMA
jgi:predicted MFS family arabinose efflux permease